MTRISIASWNINSVRARIGIVEKFLREEAPDVLCLQETKVECHLFPADMFRQLGYTHIVTHGQRMHHGVATISKVPLTDIRKYDWQANGEARHVGATLPTGIRVDNVYIPAGGDIPDRNLNPKFGQKLDFLGRMTQWSGELADATILTGDFNIAPLAEDVWNHKALLDVVSHTPIEVETLARLQAASGWVDLGRHFIAPPTPLFTWWSYRAKDWAASNRGRRLDHMWVTPDLIDKAVAHRIVQPARSWERPSDHIPLITEFDF
ncbi:exodeoxyribonuclease III [Sphingopyxis sp. MWB1]|uniref:exodeoxyribonuclease III n=1 Tax=Sphingopyxis sp. MWB1 TaxID=1537715 RepID=UPI00051A6CAD|nr:exodeoxyribonuclease III [Sphingopyxis sp. MWB1]